MNFIRYILAYFFPCTFMSNTLSDLDTSIAVAAATANDLNIAAQNNASAVNDVATRVANLPTGPTDFTAQVNAVNAINDQLVASKALIDGAIAQANTIAP